MLRAPVSSGCVPRCAACDACPADGRDAGPATVTELYGAGAKEILLGGGDATRWRAMPELLREHRKMAVETRPLLWVEGPARALTPKVLSVLKGHGVHGVLVQIEALGEAMIRAMGAGDGLRTVANAEEAGLATQARICVRPSTLGIVGALGKALFPRTAWVEVSARDFSSGARTLSPEVVERAMLASPNLHFSAHRQSERGYLPPCVLPDLWQSRATAWRTTFRESERENVALAACGECALARKCQWKDAGVLSEEAKAGARAVRDPVLPWEQPRSTELSVPEIIVKKRRGAEVLCVTPWTTMEIVDPDGRVRQCCSTWTVGDRGNVHGSTLDAVWNGAGYQAARRAMAERSVEELCQPICSRLYDEKFSEKALRIQSGSEAFVKNQLVLAEEIAERREVLSGKPLKLAVCPSTYCNYDCIMCDHGRSPRRELPESIWEELFEYLPTLSSLTLLGGEPLANPLAMKFLRAFDVAKFPDCQVDLVTNGSLLTEQALRHLRRATLGDVTVSLNAGTPEVYRRVQRGIELDQVLRNIDGLIEFRRGHHRYFGITVSFVLQPAASHTLVEFGEIARARGLRIRLMALNPENHEGLDFYLDEGLVQKVLSDTDRFLEYCERVRPEWVSEVRAGRAAVLEEAAHRRRAEAREGVRRLPVLGAGA
ncbi:MAG: radical SAM protein [Polyangiaceae bacterium]